MIRLFLFALVCLLGCDQLVEACHGSSHRQERRQSRRSGAGGCSGVAEGYGAVASYGTVGCSGGSASVGYSRTTTVAVSPHGTVVPSGVVAAPAPTVGETTVVPAPGPVYSSTTGPVIVQSERSEARPRGRLFRRNR